jgi:enoyl-CoA hydratase
VNPPVDELILERRGAVALLTLNRPERRNALSLGLLAELADVLSQLGEDPDVAAVALTGTGTDAFCAGVDLKEHAERDRRGIPFERPMTGVRRNLFELLLELPKPTLAVLNGPAVGGGCELALACDMRIAAEHAWLQLPEAQRGMGANFASVLLPRLIPRAIALELLYTGGPIQAARAEQIGLVNRVAPQHDLADVAERLLAAIAANAPLTVRRYKHIALKGWELPVHTALRLDVGPDPYGSDDRVEGVAAFLERRPARWRGR